MRLVFFFFFVIYIHSFPCFSQRTIKGNITDENGFPVVGAFIYPLNGQSGTMTDYYGNYTIQVPDSMNELLINIPMVCPVEDEACIHLGMNDVIREITTIGNDNEMNLTLIFRKNRFDTFPYVGTSKSLSDNNYKYRLKYSPDEVLMHVYLRNKKSNRLEYVWDIEYFKEYIRIHNYAWQNDKKNKNEKKYFLSTVDFYLDHHGVIKAKDVSVNYGSHFNQQYARYTYLENKKVEVFTFEGIENNYYHKPETFEYQQDMFIVIIQNEILRRNLYKNVKNKYFSTDFEIVILDN